MADASYRSITTTPWQAVASVAAATFVFGVSFGVVATASGFSVSAAVVMSATTFGGAAQMGTASVVGTGGAAAGAIVAGILLNLRYLPMGITAAPAYQGPWWRRGLFAQLLGDATWAMSRRSDGSYDSPLLLTSGGVAYVAWLVGTALGAFSLSSIGNVSTWGLDMASPAIFFALLWQQLDTRRAHLAAVSAVIIALALVPFTPPGIPIILASLACLIGLMK
jgi:predicted branched-subunit amino acid permease